MLGVLMCGAVGKLRQLYSLSK